MDGDCNSFHDIDFQYKILKQVLEDLLTGFDSEENKSDFILDICNGYKKKLEEWQRTH